jgi:hypothetical protein
LTKIEYDALKQTIVETYGKPEYDLQTPINESAKRLSALRSQRMQEGRKQAKDARLDEIRAEIPKSRLKAVLSDSNIKLPEFEIDARYLASFSETEQLVLHDHFNTNLSDTELGIKHNLTRQAVTGLLHDTRVKVLEARLFDSIGPWRNRLALLRLQEADDSKVVVRLGEHWGVIKSETKELNLNTKPIEDPKALQMLKELGDRLVDTNEKP